MSPRALRGCWGWIGALLIACSGGDEPDDSACGSEVPLEGDDSAAIGKFGSIKLAEQATAEGVQRVGTAAFVDYSTYEGTSAPVAWFGTVCTAVVGVEQEVSPVTPLESPAVSIAVGDALTEFREVGPGRLNATGLAELDEGTTVSVDVAGGEGDEQFPSFSTEIVASAAPEDLSVEEGAGGGLVIRWRPAGAIGIEIELRATAGAPEDRPVRCVVADDGCLSVSETAVGWVTQSPEPAGVDVRLGALRFGQWDGPNGEIGFLRVERHRDVAYAP